MTMYDDHHYYDMDDNDHYEDNDDDESSKCSFLLESELGCLKHWQR